MFYEIFLEVGIGKKPLAAPVSDWLSVCGVKFRPPFSIGVCPAQNKVTMAQFVGAVATIFDFYVLHLDRLSVHAVLGCTLHAGGAVNPSFDGNNEIHRAASAERGVVGEDVNLATVDLLALEHFEFPFHSLVYLGF